MTQDDSRRQAERLHKQWGNRLNNFALPCPLCRGVMHFHGVGEDRLYEFAEGEPGVVMPMEVQPITFICERCGYHASFDAELFNPAYLAELQGARPERVAALSIREYQVLVPLAGEEKTETLLDLATGIAGVHQGEVLVLHVAPDPERDPAGAQLGQRLEDYTPAPGNPAPLRLIQRTGEIADSIVAMAADKRVELLLLGWRGWTAGRQAVMGSVLDTVLTESLADVGIVHDRGLASVRRILLPTAGGPHARLAMRLALDLARAFDARLDLLYVASPALGDAEAAAQFVFAQTVRDPDEIEGVAVEQRVIVNANPVQAVVEEAAANDLLLIGASPRKGLGRMRHGDMALKIARNCNPTSIVVSARNTLLGSWLSRVLG